MIQFYTVISFFIMIFCSLFIGGNVLFNNILDIVLTVTSYVIAYLLLRGFLREKEKVLDDEFGISLCGYLSLIVIGIAIIYASKFLGNKFLWNFGNNYKGLMVFGSGMCSIVVAIYYAIFMDVAYFKENN